jgi:hypothetical protein
MRRNRVTPLGELIADPARGLAYGNRGCLHDAGEAERTRSTRGCTRSGSLPAGGNGGSTMRRSATYRTARSSCAKELPWLVLGPGAVRLKADVYTRQHRHGG